MYSLYSLLLLLALMFSAPWWLLEMLRNGKYRIGWRERWGRVPDRLFNQVSVNTIWIHAVSVGEVLAISRVVGELKAHLPGWRIVVSTTTDTGQKLARERFGENDVFYFPLDLPFCVQPYLDALRPKLLVLAESEFWPNLLRLARQSGAQIAVVNARVSDRSLPRYLRFQQAAAAVCCSSVQLFLAQSDEDAQAFGSDRCAGRACARRRKSEIRGEASRPVGHRGLAQGRRRARAARSACWWPAARWTVKRRCCWRHSATSWRAIPELCYCWRLVILSALARSLRCWRSQRFDSNAAPSGTARTPIAGGVLLLDTIGELASLYEFADLAFIGGSLVPRGGHNVLEAAQFGVPILVGPYTENFRDIVETFRRADALVVAAPDSLTSTVLQLLEDYDARVALGQRAAEVMHQQQGATERTVTALLELLQRAARLPPRSSFRRSRFESALWRSSDLPSALVTTSTTEAR